MFRLSVSAIAFYQTKAFEINGAAQQFNGREGETAAFLKRSLVFPDVACNWFRPTSSQALNA